jgi:MSHA pilin protein MshC
MRELPRGERGFTLIELIAAITIMAILAAVALPRMTTATPFQERGYADAVAANLRRAREVALATGCDVQFTINNTGYSALQRGAAGTHCAVAGAWVTPVFIGVEPPQVVLGGMRQAVFSGSDGRLVGAPITIDIGARRVSVEASGLVTGP